MSPDDSGPQAKRQASGHRSTMPLRSSPGDPQRRRSTTPRRQRFTARADGAPRRVDVGFSVADDVPWNGASTGDVRFWAYGKFGTINTRLSELASAANLLIDQAALSKAEIRARPTFQELDPILQGFPRRDEVDEKLRVQKEELKQSLETGSEVLNQHFMKASDVTDAKIAGLKAQVEVILVKLAEHVDAAEKNVRYIEEVGTNFHLHVAESFAKLESVVEQHYTPGHPQRPPGISPRLATPRTARSGTGTAITSSA